MSASPRISRRASAIELHIDTLVVDGLAIRNADHLGIVVQHQLEALLAETGIGEVARAAGPGAHLAIASLRAPTIHTARAPHAADAGEKIARAIHGGLRA